MIICYVIFCLPDSNYLTNVITILCLSRRLPISITEYFLGSGYRLDMPKDLEISKLIYTPPVIM